MSSRYIRGPWVFTDVTVVTTGDCTIVNESAVIVDKTSGAATAITLPAAPENGDTRCILIKDGKGDSATNNITITPASGTIDGAATFVLSSNYGAVVLEYNSAQGEWGAFSVYTGSGSSGTITANAITGTDSSLGITGQAGSGTGAAGGAVAIGGGAATAHTTGTGGAGGAITSTSTAGGTATTGTGGAGGANTRTAGAGGTASAAAGIGGAGGAATATAGAGGAASHASGGAAGAGGAASVTAGAGGAAAGTGAAAGGVGGAASLVAGAGGTAAGTSAAGAGGAIALTTGAGGAKTGTGAAAGGAGGALALTGGVGGATASSGADAGGAGAGITLTGGAGGAASAGTGNGGAGGSVNLVPGAGGTSAGGTAGAAGEVQVNGDANLCFATYYFTGAPAATDQVFFVAPRAMRVKSIKQVHSVAAGGASTLTVIKDTGTSAPGAGTSLHQSGSFDLNATANTVQSATLSTTAATLALAAGDRLAVKFANTIQSTAGLVVTVGLVPI